MAMAVEVLRLTGGADGGGDDDADGEGDCDYEDDDVNVTSA